MCQVQKINNCLLHFWNYTMDIFNKNKEIEIHRVENSILYLAAYQKSEEKEKRIILRR